MTIEKNKSSADEGTFFLSEEVPLHGAALRGAMLQTFILKINKQISKREGRSVSVREPARTREARELPAHGPGERVLLELCLDKQACELVRSVHKHIWHGPPLGSVAHVRSGTERRDIAYSDTGAGGDFGYFCRTSPRRPRPFRCWTS